MCDDANEVFNRIQVVLSTSLENVSANKSILLENLKCLRNLCARGAHFQDAIVSHVDFNNFLDILLFDGEYSKTYPQLHLMSLQLLANAIVNNPTTQRAVWQRHGDKIMALCALPPLGRSTDIRLMIIYNIFLGHPQLLNERQLFATVVHVWEAIISERCSEDFDFLHFFFEHFLVKNGRNTVRLYAQLEPMERIAFLDYLANYLRHNSPNGLVHSFLLQHISKEFKIKSDCILRQSTAEQLHQIQPREAYALLRVIASASGSENYADLYANDHSLFLNVSSLLRCLVAAGKDAQKNLFTPMNKLEEVAVNSNISRDFELEISFELKTLLVRCVANLLYKNKTNQGYCLDTELMPSLLECTNMDARNPLIKEWSILAIRNACIGCPEIQQVIANLTKLGDAPNDILNELNLEMGALRIQPNKE